MSRFSDFDEFLKREEKTADETLQHLQRSRDDHDPLVREVFRVFQEYYDTVIKPRKDYFVIAKKQESLPKSYKLTADTPYYHYRINLVPKDILPLSLTPLTVTNSDFLKPGTITNDDWHPYVALQFDLTLHDTLVDSKLSPAITLRLWGEIEQKEALLEEMISIRTIKSPLSVSTELKVKYNKDQNAFIDTFTRALMTLTPAILVRK